MKRILAVAVFITMVGVASAQISVPCLITAAQTSQTLERNPVRRGYVPENRIFPVFSYTSYSVGGMQRAGTSLMLQGTLSKTPKEAIDILGGFMIRFRDPSEPVDASQYAPLGLRPDEYPRSSRSFLRGLRFGMAFSGLEYTWYLTETDIRPYVGAGGMIMMWPYEGDLAGSVAPTVKAGVLATMSSGFTGFAEIKRIIGLPLVIGGESPPLRNLTGFAFGIAFAPQWN